MNYLDAIKTTINYFFCCICILYYSKIKILFVRINAYIINMYVIKKISKRVIKFNKNKKALKAFTFNAFNC